MNSQSILNSKKLEIADSLYMRGKYSEAQNLFLEVQREFYIICDWPNWYKCFKGVCRINIKTNNGEYLVNQVQGITEELPENEHKLRGMSYAYLAYALNQSGRIYKASKNSEKSITQKLMVLDTSNFKSMSSLMRAYYNLSFSYSKLGDQKSAIKYIKESINFARKIDHEDLCKYYTVLGKYYFHGNQTDAALRQYEYAIEMCGEDFSTYQYIAEIYLQIDSLDRAKYFLNLSKKIISQSKPEDECIQDVLLSKYYKQTGHEQIAIKVLNELIEEDCFNSSRKKYKILVNFAQLLFENDSIIRSVEIADEVIETIFPFADSTNNIVRPILNDELPDVWVIEAFLLKAKYYHNQFLESNNINFLNEAEFYYNSIFAFFDEMKLSYNSVESQYRLGSYTSNIYSSVISFYIEMYETTNDSKYYNNAFLLIQQSNAFVLRNSVGERKAFELLNISKDTIEEYFYLKSLVGDNAQDTLNKGFNFVKFNTFDTHIKSKYPALNNYVDENIIDMIGVQSKLGDSDLFINYYFDEEKIFAFVISKTKHKVFEIGLDSKLKSNLNSFYKQTSSSLIFDESEFPKQSNEIYKSILEPILNDKDFLNKESLIVVPSGPLKQISFSALIINEVKRRILPSNYLISTHDIIYLFYAGQLINEQNNRNNNRRFIGFGIEYTDEFLEEILEDYKLLSTDLNETRSLSLANLVNADDEVLNNALTLNGKAIVNEKATLASVYENISNFNIVHFSAHALNDNSDYLNSFLVLNKDKNNDFQLKYKDIVNLNLKNELIVLSACQTGIGESIQSEGAMSLSRAFLHSGAKTSLGNYWNAPDKATKELMNLFYQNINNGLSKSKALQQAQLDYLSDDKISSPSVRSPFYWSGWAMYGTNGVIPQDQYNYTFVIIGFSIVLLCMILLIGLKRKFKEK